MIIFTGYGKSFGFTGGDHHWQCTDYLSHKHTSKEGQTKYIIVVGLGLADGDKPGVADSQ